MPNYLSQKPFKARILIRYGLMGEKSLRTWYVAPEKLGRRLMPGQRNQQPEMRDPEFPQKSMPLN
jgi:hypothetical protein